LYVFWIDWLAIFKPWNNTKIVNQQTTYLVIIKLGNEAKNIIVGCRFNLEKQLINTIY
jgi:hypothetical protein